MTIQQYRIVLRQRRSDLKASLIVDAYDGNFIEPSDKRYREYRLINRMLKLLRNEV